MRKTGLAMKTFTFEIQELVNVKVKAETVEEARMKVLNLLENKEIEFVDPTISDGQEVDL